MGTGSKFSFDLGRTRMFYFPSNFHHNSFTKSSRSQMFFEIGVLKNFAIILKKTSVLESLFSLQMTVTIENPSYNEIDVAFKELNIRHTILMNLFHHRMKYFFSNRKFFRLSNSFAKRKNVQI